MLNKKTVRFQFFPCLQSSGGFLGLAKSCVACFPGRDFLHGGYGENSPAARVLFGMRACGYVAHIFSGKILGSVCK